jgi:hypothetical protein
MSLHVALHVVFLFVMSALFSYGKRICYESHVHSYKIYLLFFPHFWFIIDASKFEDNQPTLDLLELKPTGIFSMIDEEISVPRGSDEGLLSKIFQKYSSHPNIQR